MAMTGSLSLRCLAQAAAAPAQRMLPIAASPKALGGLMTPTASMTMTKTLSGARSPSVFPDREAGFGRVGRFHMGDAEATAPARVAMARPGTASSGGYPVMLGRRVAFTDDAPAPPVAAGGGRRRLETATGDDDDAAARARAAFLARRNQKEDRHSAPSAQTASSPGPAAAPPSPASAPSVAEAASREAPVEGPVLLGRGRLPRPRPPAPLADDSQDPAGAARTAFLAFRSRIGSRAALLLALGAIEEAQGRVARLRPVLLGRLRPTLEHHKADATEDLDADEQGPAALARRHFLALRRAAAGRTLTEAFVV